MRARSSKRKTIAFAGVDSLEDIPTTGSEVVRPAAEDADKYEEAQKVAQDAMTKAEAMDHPPLLAETLHMLGSISLRVGDYEESEKALTAAYRAAGTSDSPEVAARSATLLVDVVGHKKAELSEGIIWGHAAEAAISQVEPEEGLLTATLLNNLANIHHDRKNYEEAKRLYQRVLDIRKKELDPQHPEVSQGLNNLAVIHFRLKD